MRTAGVRWSLSGREGLNGMWETVGTLVVRAHRIPALAPKELATCPAPGTKSG